MNVSETFGKDFEEIADLFSRWLSRHLCHHQLRSHERWRHPNICRATELGRAQSLLSLTVRV